jgi:hypothetical protein
MAASFEDLLQRAAEVSRFEAFAERMSRPATPAALPRTDDQRQQDTWPGSVATEHRLGRAVRRRPRRPAR